MVTILTQYDYPHAEKVKSLNAQFGRMAAAPQVIALLRPVVDADFEKDTVTDGAFLNLMVAFRKSRNTDLYRIYVDEAYAIAPSSMAVAREKINLFLQDNNNEGVHRVIDTLEKIPGLENETLLARAQQYRHEGNIADALTLLEKHIHENDTPYALACHEAGTLIRFHNGDLSKSITYFEKAMAAYPSSSNLQESYAVALTEYADSIVESDPDSAMALREKSLQILQLSSPTLQKRLNRMISFLTSAVTSSDRFLKYSYDGKR